MPLSVGKHLISRMRLRHKLAVSLSITALLPVLAVPWIAGSVVLGNLESGIREDTERQVQVGLSLVLRSVERLGGDAIRLASAGDLDVAMAAMAAPQGVDPELGATPEVAPASPEDTPLAAVLDRPGPDQRTSLVQRFLDEVSPHLPSSLVQVLGQDGQPVAEIVVGKVEPRFVGLRVKADSPTVQSGLSYHNLITIEAAGNVMVVRATAPILDSSYRLLGAVVMSVPLDGPFADEVKGALGTDVMFFAGAGEEVTAALSTFFNATGEREQGIVLRPDIASRLQPRKAVLSRETVFGRQYVVGYTPLLNVSGERVGIFGVAVDRAPVIDAKTVATQSLFLVAGGGFVFALLLAGLLSRRLTRPLGRLHRGAQAIARGDLSSHIAVTSGDEIGDLAEAFSRMTQALKENQERLAERMREIVALHDAGRAISSVIELDQVLRTIVDSVARVFDGRVCALWLVDSDHVSEMSRTAPASRLSGRLAGHLERTPGSAEFADMLQGDEDPPPPLYLGAARAKPASMRTTLRGDAVAMPLSTIAAQVAVSRTSLRVDRATAEPNMRDAAIAAGVTGSLLATPLERKGAVIGVLIVGRGRKAKAFSPADASLLATFADQAAAAVENARLYQEVWAFNEELEGKVRARTAELTRINTELGRALTELRETQSQLILSERMAGLGLLVAGVAHEINSPSAAIAGSVDALSKNVLGLTTLSQTLHGLALSAESERRFLDLVSAHSSAMAQMRMGSAVAVRRATRALRERMQAAGVSEDVAARCARKLTESGAPEELLAEYIHLCAAPEPSSVDERARAFADYIHEYVFLQRNAHTIRNAIARIQRIVGALKTYSHLDQEAGRAMADIHEGIEDTLAILDYVLRDIKVYRNYSQLPKIPVFVDELNQVWTNLIHNAAQALVGSGEIAIETAFAGDSVFVRVIDNGPGIPESVLPRIFEPFYTTKPKGEGTGLGLGIVRQIVTRHGGAVTCESRPGRTCFEVRLPMMPEAKGAVAAAAGAPEDSGATQESGSMEGTARD